MSDAPLSLYDVGTRVKAEEKRQQTERVREGKKRYRDRRREKREWREIPGLRTFIPNQTRVVGMRAVAIWRSGEEKRGIRRAIDNEGERE